MLTTGKECPHATSVAHQKVWTKLDTGGFIDLLYLDKVRSVSPFSPSMENPIILWTRWLKIDASLVPLPPNSMETPEVWDDYVCPRLISVILIDRQAICIIIPAIIFILL